MSDTILDAEIIDLRRSRRGSQKNSTLWLLIVAGLAIRLFGLNSQSYWLDEGASLHYVQIHNSAWSIISSLAKGGDNHPPLHFLALHAMNSFFGITNEIAMRMPSVIASTLLIPAAWMLAGVVAPRARVLAAALAAFSPFLIWYAQEARMYAMAEAFAAWSFVAYFKVINEKRASMRKRWLALHVICRVAGF